MVNRKRVRKELVIEKEYKKNADERALEIKNINFECRVKKFDAQLIKWRRVKNEIEKLNLNENDFNKWTNQQLRSKKFKDKN